MNYTAENGGRKENATVKEAVAQNGESLIRVLTRDAEATDERVPRARGGVGVVVAVDESLGFFEAVGYEECPCEDGVGSGSGGDHIVGVVVVVEEVDD